MTRVSACTEAGGGQDEDLLGDGVDLSYTLVIVDDGNSGLSDPQRNGAG